MSAHDKQDRGDATREALIAAATRIFARRGFDAASSRQLAAEAGVNQALISYHFGGKSGLYLAVFEHMAKRVRGQVMPGIQSVAAEIEAMQARPALAKDSAVGCIVRLLHVLADVFLGQDTADWGRLVLREQQEPTEAFEVLYEGAMKHMLGTMTRLVEFAVEGEEAADPRIVALTLLSQVMVFRMANAAVVRHLGWTAGLGEDQVRTIKEQIGLNVRARFG